MLNTGTQYYMSVFVSSTNREINVYIDDYPPFQYFAKVLDQCHGGYQKSGDLDDEASLRINLSQHCVSFDPTHGMDMVYSAFLSDK